jgi:hypothetical protein
MDAKGPSEQLAGFFFPSVAPLHTQAAAYGHDTRDVPPSWHESARAGSYASLNVRH